jgi:hypothetical protein
LNGILEDFVKTGYSKLSETEPVAVGWTQIRRPLIG